MDYVFTLLAGLGVGAFAGWLLAAWRGRAQHAQGTHDQVRQLAASEATVTELRRQVSESEIERQAIANELDRQKEARVASETRLESSLANLEEQRKLLTEAREELSDAFRALSADALKGNSDQFMTQAKANLQPLESALKAYEERVREIENKREAAYARVNQSLTTIGTSHERLQRETGRLVSALRAPHIRGRWGELTLRRLVEVTGMSAHCDYTEQASTGSEESRLRPDLIVHLPGRRTIVVDAKTPLKHYIDAVESEDDEARQRLIHQHAGAVRAHMVALSRKDYSSQFSSAPDWVVLFLPGEAFFSAALEADPSLIEDGSAMHVIVASPTTLLAMLRSVAYSWQEQHMVENAREISQCARELFDRIGTFAGEHFSDVGKALAKAVEAFNKSVRSWESRVEPAGKRLPDLGSVAKDAGFPSLSQITISPATQRLSSLEPTALMATPLTSE